MNFTTSLRKPVSCKASMQSTWMQKLVLYNRCNRLGDNIPVMFQDSSTRNLFNLLHVAEETKCLNYPEEISWAFLSVWKTHWSLAITGLSNLEMSNIFHTIFRIQLIALNNMMLLKTKGSTFLHTGPFKCWRKSFKCWEKWGNFPFQGRKVRTQSPSVKCETE